MQHIANELSGGAISAARGVTELPVGRETVAHETKKYRPINLDVHNVVDYALVASALAAPYALGFSDHRLAKNSLQALYLASGCKDLCTRYRYSATKKIPIGVHMCLDLAVGVATVAAPFVLGFWKDLQPRQKAVFLGLGLGVFPLVAMTHPRTEKEKRGELAEGSDVKSLAY